MKITLLTCCSILLAACGAPSPKPVHGILVPINRSVVVGKVSANRTDPVQSEPKPPRSTAKPTVAVKPPPKPEAVKATAQKKAQPKTIKKTEATPVAVNTPPSPAKVDVTTPKKPLAKIPLQLSWHDHETLRHALNRWVKKAGLNKLVWDVFDEEGDLIDIPIASNHTFKKGLNNALYQVKKAYATAPINPIVLNFTLKMGNKTLVVTHNQGEAL